MSHHVKAHLERELPVARVHDVASARRGLLKGVLHGEHPSVACSDDLEDVRWHCREFWPTRGTDGRVQ